MSYDFNNDLPIYLQIIERIKMQIIKSEFKPLDKLPSVRELSCIYEVNPNTVQKALFELESMGLIFTERTNGKFVTEDLSLIEKVLHNNNLDIPNNIIINNRFYSYLLYYYKYISI